MKRSRQDIFCALSWVGRKIILVPLRGFTSALTFLSPLMTVGSWWVSVSWHHLNGDFSLFTDVVCG